MKYIDPLLFSKFTRNELPKHMMKEVEADMLTSGTANAVFHSLIEEYHQNDDTNELIGEDEETIGDIWQEREKKFDMICKNLLTGGSIVIYNLNNTSMNNMNFTQEDMARVTKRYNAIADSANAELTLKENLVNAYMKSKPEISEEEAINIVNRLIDGCETLTKKYNEAFKDSFNVESEIATLCKGKNTEEKFTFLINALAVVETLNVDSYDSLGNVKEALQTAIESYKKSDHEPTEEDCDAMTKNLADALRDNTLLISGLEKAQEILHAANKTNTIIDFAAEQYDDAKMKAEMALAAWIEYESGNMPSAGTDATPESIGIGAATAVEEAKIMSDVAKGNKTMDIAIMCLKVLGAVALTCILGYISCLGITAVLDVVASGLIYVFGTSTIACIATMALIIPLMFGMAFVLVDPICEILEEANDIFDIVVDELRNSIIPKIEFAGKRFINWLRSLFSQQNDGNDFTTVAIPAY